MPDLIDVTLSRTADGDVETCETDWNGLDDDVAALVRMNARGELHAMPEPEKEHAIDAAIRQLRDDFDGAHSSADLPDWYELRMVVTRV